MELGRIFCLKCSILNYLIHHRSLSLCFILKKNHYDTLGITPNATLSDIKKAYYNLSMVYHPDKNDGSAEAQKKFRDLTEAYEVLTNLKTKKLYDKGAGYTAPVKSKEQPKPKKRVYVPENTGKTVYYDFDQWSREHYGESVVRRAAAKQRYADLTASEFEDIQSRKAKLIVCSLLFLIVLYAFHKQMNEDLDNPPEFRKADK